MTFNIRSAQLADLPTLLQIYAPFVTDSTATFDETVPTLVDFTQQFLDIQKTYPYLVVENEQGALLGYCYAHAYNSRLAYQWSVETTIYLAKDARGQHVGKKLYQVLEQKLMQQNIVNCFACITAENASSIAFHHKQGYKTVGRFKNSGYKFGHWLDTVWMEKQISDLPNQPQPILSS
ncbi:N-acetyltransferase [Weissella viridescens]|uniref:N-acetyltransferase n=1 Tax=Weissella viridescens TaxID=1629 RepID=A0A3P2RC24_WEIVI|nr:GNAT family N-acetyltransferase [Weissella viridescens]RRG18309.1 N-acetyltransferase [Weissella viridescens]